MLILCVFLKCRYWMCLCVYESIRRRDPPLSDSDYTRDSKPSSSQSAPLWRGGGGGSLQSNVNLRYYKLKYNWGWRLSSLREFVDIKKTLFFFIRTINSLLINYFHFIDYLTVISVFIITFYHFVLLLIKFFLLLISFLEMIHL